MHIEYKDKRCIRFYNNINGTYFFSYWSPGTCKHQFKSAYFLFTRIFFFLHNSHLFIIEFPKVYVYINLGWSINERLSMCIVFIQTKSTTFCGWKILKNLFKRFITCGSVLYIKITLDNVVTWIRVTNI